MLLNPYRIYVSRAEIVENTQNLNIKVYVHAYEKFKLAYR